MASTLSWFDRLRIERFVWRLDSLLYDLPWRSRVEKRREVRQNLIAAAGSVGTGKALRQLGGSAQLAREYLNAEFGDRPRHSWMAAALFGATTLLVATSLWTEAALGFGDGVTAARPDATGTYTWDGIPYLQNDVTYTFTHGHGTYAGGGFTPLFWLLWLAGIILVGRLWRIAARWRRSGQRQREIGTRPWS
jgi:hypothetical protein